MTLGYVLLLHHYTYTPNQFGNFFDIVNFFLFLDYLRTAVGTKLIIQLQKQAHLVMAGVATLSMKIASRMVRFQNGARVSSVMSY